MWAHCDVCRANDATRRAKRSTVMPESVLAAIKGEMDFGDAMTDALKECADVRCSCFLWLSCFPR